MMKDQLIHCLSHFNPYLECQNIANCFFAVDFLNKTLLSWALLLTLTRARIELILPIGVGVIGTQLSSSVTEVDRCISIACHPGVYQYTCDY